MFPEQNTDRYDPKKRYWYAIYTRPRFEKVLYNKLIDTDIEAFLPLQIKYRQWSDRKKRIKVPLISSYVFVYINASEFSKIYRTHGFVKFITFEGKHIAIPQNQIDNLKLLSDNEVDLEISTEEFSKGDNVEVIAGSLIGLKGELIKINGKKRVLIRIDSIDRNIILSIPPAFLKKQ